MSIEKVREALRRFGREQAIIEFDSSTATVAEAAVALGVDAARIAKSIAVHVRDKTIVIVIAGDMKLSNRKFKEQFKTKLTMLSPEETLASTGHPVGGVCPFGLPEGVDVFLDHSLRRFETVFPACGSAHSAIALTLHDLALFSNNCAWVDLCQERSG
ncbi:MAG: YbaK/EbsC family protein [Treponema sp.]|jgi:prolyl-tRNA editing enzyme YbaK/EbsC (Cys-tRNA(Pro) deacylase)|nr:YbaK/EbsC family protein [Treponema sp.]